mgnify:CR=1 FL=1
MYFLLKIQKGLKRKKAALAAWLLLPVVLLLPLSCEDVLEPEPVDRITDDLVLTDASSVRVVIQNMFRGMASLNAVRVIAGDMTADLLKNNGTFTQYIELGTHELSASNASASAMWGTIYSINYTANFLLERLPGLEDVLESQKEQFEAYARYFRGYSYFVGAWTFGAMPLVTSTSISENRNIGRTPVDELLQFAEADLLFALNKLPVESFNSGDLTNGAVKATLARFYLYQQNWQEAERFADEVIAGAGTENYVLEQRFADVLEDFNQESILEIVYSANDNPGSSASFGLYNLFVDRREVIPSDQIVFELQGIGADRDIMINFNAQNIGRGDNGWTVARYGQFSNVPVFRLAEMYLVRAEARAQQNELSSARADLNTIRQRAGAPASDASTQNLLLQEIYNERVVELAFEGHRWYDLKRTGRATAVMNAITENWSETDLLWPVPLREIQNNPALSGQQNPGY